MGPWSIVGIMGLLSPFLHQKTVRVFFHLLLRKTIDIQNGQLCGLIYPSPVIYFSKISGGL